MIPAAARDRARSMLFFSGWATLPTPEALEADVENSIVVAVDGSEPSLAGVAFAAPLAKALGARLELAYVSRPNLLLPDIYPDAHRRVDALEAAHAEELLGKAKQAAAALGVEAVGVRLTDGTADSVAIFAQAARVWAVVVGARGHNRISRVLLGSFADRLVHVCEKPVFLVR